MTAATVAAAEGAEHTTMTATTASTASAATASGALLVWAPVQRSVPAQGEQDQADDVRAVTGEPVEGGGWPLDLAGTMTLLVGRREAAWPVTAVPAPAVVAAAAWLVTGDPGVMMGLGLGSAAFVMAVDRRVTRAHRWSTNVRAGRGRRRTDSERLADMAASA